MDTRAGWLSLDGKGSKYRDLSEGWEIVESLSVFFILKLVLFLRMDAHLKTLRRSAKKKRLFSLQFKSHQHFVKFTNTGSPTVRDWRGSINGNAHSKSPTLTANQHRANCRPHDYLYFIIIFTDMTMMGNREHSIWLVISKQRDYPYLMGQKRLSIYLSNGTASFTRSIQSTPN